jgi:6-oxo-cyclohex-1-ene-carbonyl-CoA hydrolase
MALDWIPREGGIKDHDLWGDQWFGKEPPSTGYELKPVIDNSGNPVDGLFSAWVTLNNPAQYNSYTTEMVKGVIAGFNKASMNRRVVAIVFTGTGDKSFCTGGNTKEYAEYYSKKPEELLFAGLTG